MNDKNNNRDWDPGPGESLDLHIKNTTVKEVFTISLEKLPVELRADLPIDEQEVELIFINGALHEVELKFEAPYSREQWRILSIIEKKISEIENTVYGQKNKL